MQDIIFDEIGHTYTRKGNIVPSATHIISEVYGTGLESAPSQFVERASGKGTFHHKEFDVYLKTEMQGESPEFKKWFEWLNFRYGVWGEYESEKIIYATTPYGPFAGTLDFYANHFVWDWKTSKTATKKQIKKWQMQNSLYIYAMRQMGYIVNEPGKIVHITAEKVELINVDYLGDAWVEETVRKYYAGEKVEQKPETSLQTVNENTLATLGNVLKQIAELEKSIAPIKEQIKDEMEKRGILTLKAGDVVISYVSAHKAKKFDSARFKADNAEMYEQYTKESEVKSSIRIKVD